MQSSDATTWRDVSIEGVAGIPAAALGCGCCAIGGCVTPTSSAATGFGAMAAASRSLRALKPGMLRANSS